MDTLELHVSLDGRQDLSREIYRQLRHSILDGGLRAGDRLPPTRLLARGLGVARNTVAVAYERLWSEGLISSRVGAGTFVSGNVAVAFQHAQADASVSSLKARGVWDRVRVEPLPDDHLTFNFYTGMPDTGLFPHKVWRRMIDDQLGAQPAHGHDGHPAGHTGLRQAIAHHVRISRGLKDAPDNVVITTGTQQALDIIARVLLEPGDRVAMEDPGYPRARLPFESLGCHVQGVPVDGEGLMVQALPPETRLVYVCPSHQYPLGMTMSLPRRLALLAWAEQHDAAIVEDDYDGEFRFRGRPIEPLQTLDVHGRVIYVGSFSKTLLPSLRLGFIVTPGSLREAMHKAKYASDGHTPLHTQAALASFINQGEYARHLRKMRSIYEERHDVVVDILHRDFGGLVDVLPSAAGLHVTARTPGVSIDEVAEVRSHARAAGIAFHQLAGVAYQQPPEAGMMLGFGAATVPNIEEGLRRLRACFVQVSGR